MDALRAESIERAQRTSPAEKARQTSELIDVGFALKRAGLRAKHPGSSEAELEALFAEWLAAR